MAKDLELVIKLLKNEQKEAIKYRPLMKQEELRIIEEIENEKIGLYDDEFINNMNHIILNAIPKNIIFDQGLAFIHAGWELLESIILEYKAKKYKDKNSFMWSKGARTYHAYERKKLETIIKKYVVAESEIIEAFTDNLLKDFEAEKIIDTIIIFGERGVNNILYSEEIWITTGEATAGAIDIGFLDGAKISMHSYGHELGKKIISNFTYVLKIKGVL